MKKIDKNDSFIFWEIIPKNQVFLANFLYDYDIKSILERNHGILLQFICSESKFIKVHLNLVMFDCLAHEFSDGFFDENDTPPVELWVDYKHNEYVIAFIPKEFEEIVDICVQDTMSESIEWFQYEMINLG